MCFFPLHAIYGTEFLKSVECEIIFLHCLLLLLTSRIVNIMNRIVGLLFILAVLKYKLLVTFIYNNVILQLVTLC